MATGADVEAALASRTHRSNRFLRNRLWMRMTRETFTPDDEPFPAALICVRRGGGVHGVDVGLSFRC